jgi:hypothetical protein
MTTHAKAVAMVSRDDSICIQCGGWLGRRDGMKPWCSRGDCPGRTAPKEDSVPSPQRRTQSSPVLRPAPAPPPSRPSPDRLAEARTRTAPNGYMRRQLSEDDDEDPAPRSAPTRERPPSSRPRVFVNPSHDEEEAADIRARAAAAGLAVDSPRLTVMGILKGLPKPGLLMLGIAWLWGFVLTERDAPWGILGLVTLQPSDKFLVLFTSTVLVAAYPFSAYLLHWLTEPRFRQIRWVALAYLLSTLSVISLLFLIVEPYIPPPGGLVKRELCIDWVSRPPAIRFDSARVVGGPCFRLAIETVGGES